MSAVAFEEEGLTLWAAFKLQQRGLTTGLSAPARALRVACLAGNPGSRARARLRTLLGRYYSLPLPPFVLQVVC